MGKASTGMSLRTAKAKRGGGIGGALATITEIGCVDDFDYGGRQKKTQAAIRSVFDIDGFDKPWEQHYSFGPSDRYEIVGDGAGVKSVVDDEGMNDNCIAFKFIEAVEEAAQEGNIDLDDLLPEEDGYTSVLPLQGRRVILKSIEYETVGGDKKTIPVIAKFVDDEESGGKKAGRGNGKVGTTKSVKGVEAKTEKLIESYLEDGTVKKTDLGTKIAQDARKDSDVRAMCQLAFKESWLADDNRPWEYDRKRGVLKAKD